MEFHEKLQWLRKQRGLTQEELAESLFVSRTAISKWESGRGYPNIDSLKALSRFFSVTIDELLSGEEMLTLAEEDNKQKEQRCCDLLFGLLDCSMILLFFLPFFGQKAEGTVKAVSLLALQGMQLYAKAGILTFVIGMVIWGLLTLSLQNCQHGLWLRFKNRTSLAFSAGAVILMTLCQQPYAAVFAFVFAAVKACFLLKTR